VLAGSDTFVAICFFQMVLLIKLTKLVSQLFQFRSLFQDDDLFLMMADHVQPPV
jgi:hypothetical protein